MNTKGRKTVFVDALAWVSLVIFGFGAFILAVQTLMLLFLFNGVPAQLLHDRPPMSYFLLENLYLILPIGFLLAVATVVAARGLMRRKNWARLWFIGLLCFGVAYLIVGAFFQEREIEYYLQRMISEMPEAAGGDFEQRIRLFFRFLYGGMALVMSLLLAWVVKKLFSQEVKQEFLRKEGSL